MIEAKKKVRIVMQKMGPNDPVTILRGDIVQTNSNAMVITGRRFAKVIDAASTRAEEKPLDDKQKQYLIPFQAVRFVEVIADGSPEDLLDKKIRLEPPIRRKGAFALID